MGEKTKNRAPAVAGGLLRVGKIYHEPDVADYARGREILDRFPGAERVEVPSHWNIPELHGDAGGVGDWARNKKSVLVLGVKKGLGIRSFSMNAGSIPRVKQAVRALDIGDCARFARRVMEQSDPARIRELVAAFAEGVAARV